MSEPQVRVTTAREAAREAARDRRAMAQARHVERERAEEEAFQHAQHVIERVGARAEALEAERLDELISGPKLNPNQKRRALRLLAAAETADAAKVKAKADMERREAEEKAARTARDAEAASLTERFRAVGLDVEVRTSVNEWHNGVPVPSLWFNYGGIGREGHEAFWRGLLERLEQAQA